MPQGAATTSTTLTLRKSLRCNRAPRHLHTAKTDFSVLFWWGIYKCITLCNTSTGVYVRLVTTTPRACCCCCLRIYAMNTFQHCCNKKTHGFNAPSVVPYERFP